MEMVSFIDISNMLCYHLSIGSKQAYSCLLRRIDERDGKMKKIPMLTKSIAAMFIFTALTGAVAVTVRNSSKDDAVKYLSHIAYERVNRINGCIENAEKTLICYSKETEIVDLINEPSNKETAENAQLITQEYSKKTAYLNEIYASDNGEHILTHSNAGCIGIIPSNDADAIKKINVLADLSDSGVYNAGIKYYPLSENTHLVLYKTVCDENSVPVGLTCLLTSADQFVESNDIPSLNSVEVVSCSLISVKDQTYLISSDPALPRETVNNDEIISLCSELSGSDASAEGIFEFKNNSEKHISSYSYMPEYSWLLVFDAKLK